MTTTRQIPATQNEAYGFFGTMNEQADAAWSLATTAIADATQEPLESVRAFLDSKHGRHFADDVLNGWYAGLELDDAIDAATRKWMGWKIDRRVSKAHGIPHGLPYLTGFVIDSAIADESTTA
jgi:hypothetical protein